MLYEKIYFTPSIKEVRSEDALKQIIKELKIDIKNLSIDNSENYVASLVNGAFNDGRDYIPISKGSGHQIRLDISEAIQAAKNYECIRNNPDFCEQVLGPSPAPLERILAEV